MELPLVTFDSVFHIGSLDPADKGRHGPSYEGHGLSVSRDPELWCEIARLGGYPWHELTKEGGRFLDAHALPRQRRKAIIAWGVKEGYVERVTCYTASWFDDELDDEVQILLETRADAELEAGDEGAVKVKKEIRGTDKLDQALGFKTGLGCFDFLLVVYVEVETDLDGVWWEDDYRHLSAPRGVILPSKVEEWASEVVHQPALAV